MEIRSNLHKVEDNGEGVETDSRIIRIKYQQIDSDRTSKYILF